MIIAIFALICLSGCGFKKDPYFGYSAGGNSRGAGVSGNAGMRLRF